MAKTKRLFKSFFRLLLPVVLLLSMATIAASIWLVHAVGNPPKTEYLVTPDKYGRLSTRGAQVTDEKWSNKDGSQSRGWLLRGADNAPAIILFHRYGADRSYVLDLGVKLNEATDFTVLMPDERGHGTNPPVKFTSFGGSETEDALAAVEYLRSLKSATNAPLVNQSIGIYGVEMGALTALTTAAKNGDVRALVLDSVPSSSDDLLASVVDKRFPFASSVTSKFAQLGTRFYFYDNSYKREPACEAAKILQNRQVLLLAGSDAPHFQSSTTKLGNCFPSNTKTESKTDLNPSGYSIMNASIEQSGAYDQRVIEFFKLALAQQ